MFTGSAVTVQVIRTSAVKFSTLSLKSAAQFGALHSLALKFIEKAEAATAVAVAVTAEAATTAHTSYLSFLLHGQDFWVIFCSTQK